ncbi:hypothetical protein FLONG3_4518 [Fusarium longipes]|uniref:Rhodopsin domain-containing protein n=1 Tax=Fusarium longipes TaxID=694270 RepID=A0A395SZ27_9HYPO|nr:hypothetical protein FLONG3_4518 [Fusarium longipes]
MMGGKAPMALAIMWSLVAITWIFVVLRLYTRAFIIRSVGMDDYTYLLSGILILLYTVFVHISGYHGFGMPMPGLDAISSEFDEAALAIKYEMIGQTFSVVGMAVAKMSLGFFLLRIVVEKWQRISIWFVMGSLSVVSALAAVMLWTQCRPVQKIFDPIRTEGVCTINVTPYATTLGVWCVLADFFFATFPWIFIWNLNMRQKEKIMIAASMSFGVVAGACGIVRTYEVVNGFTSNYTLDTVPLIVWSSAEMTVTLVCIGIPILRPFWRRVILGSSLSAEQYSGNKKDGNNREIYQMDKIPEKNDGGQGISETKPRFGIRGPSTITRIVGDNKSDESILGAEYRQPEESTPSPGASAISVKRDT